MSRKSNSNMIQVGVLFLRSSVSLSTSQKVGETAENSFQKNNVQFSLLDMIFLPPRVNK